MVLSLYPSLPNATPAWEFLSPFCYGPFLKCHRFSAHSATHLRAKFLGNRRIRRKGGKKKQKQRQCHYRTIWKTLGGSKGHMVCPWQIGLQKSSPWFETDFSSKLCNQLAHLLNVLKICMQNSLHRFQERKCRTSTTLIMITGLVESPRMRAGTAKGHGPGHRGAGTP